MADVTVLLERAQGGDVQARNELFARLYAELNRLARQKLARESALTQLDAPSLLHETYLRKGYRLVASVQHSQAAQLAAASDSINTLATQARSRWRWLVVVLGAQQR